jgi:class 3 adenylate cyclase
VGRLAETFNAMVTGLKQRDQIKGLFKRYLNPQVVEELIRHPEKASPGGEKRQLTLLFSDLVGFTTASEKLSPEELVGLLNRYFEAATRALAKYGATLDKFIGDAIMCFWNAPLKDPLHASNACLSALALLEVVDTLREPFEQAGFPVFDCRIGINTGPCVVGNLGSADAQYYTAMGDAVNLASRLEGACKEYGTRTLVSEETVREAHGAVVARELDLVRVKGRGHPVRVFELIGPAGTPLPAHVTRYAEALALFRARRFDEAGALFAMSPEDPPSRVFALRCQALKAAPPAEGWDGVHTLSSK